MSKISTLGTYEFRKDEALGYFQRVSELATATLTNERDAVVLALYKNSVESYKAALQQDFFKEETKAMNEANRLVHRQYRGLRRVVQGMMLHSSKQVQQNAENVLHIIDKYKNINGKSLDHRYGVLEAMMDELSALNSDTQTQLGITTWLEELTLAIAKFKITRDIQRNERVEYQTGLVKNCRAEVERCYRTLTNAVNAYAITFGESDYSTFINQMNAMINVEKAMLKARSTRSEHKKEDSEMPSTPEGEDDNNTEKGADEIENSQVA